MKEVQAFIRSNFLDRSIEQLIKEGDRLAGDELLNYDFKRG